MASLLQSLVNNNTTPVDVNTNSLAKIANNFNSQASQMNQDAQASLNAIAQKEYQNKSLDQTKAYQDAMVQHQNDMLGVDKEKIAIAQHDKATANQGNYQAGIKAGFIKPNEAYNPDFDYGTFYKNAEQHAINVSTQALHNAQIANANANAAHTKAQIDELKGNSDAYAIMNGTYNKPSTAPNGAGLTSVPQTTTIASTPVNTPIASNNITTVAPISQSSNVGNNSVKISNNQKALDNITNNITSLSQAIESAGTDANGKSLASPQQLQQLSALQKAQEGLKANINTLVTPVVETPKVATPVVASIKEQKIAEAKAINDPALRDQTLRDVMRTNYDTPSVSSPQSLSQIITPSNGNSVSTPTQTKSPDVSVSTPKEDRTNINYYRQQKDQINSLNIPEKKKAEFIAKIDTQAALAEQRSKQLKQDITAENELVNEAKTTYNVIKDFIPDKDKQRIAGMDAKSLKDYIKMNYGEDAVKDPSIIGHGDMYFNSLMSDIMKKEDDKDSATNLGQFIQVNKQVLNAMKPNEVKSLFDMVAGRVNTESNSFWHNNLNGSRIGDVLDNTVTKTWNNLHPDKKLQEY